MKTRSASHLFTDYVGRSAPRALEDGTATKDASATATSSAVSGQIDVKRPSRDAVTFGPDSNVDEARKIAGLTLDTENDHRFDGHFIGAGGKTYAPGTSLSDVPPVTPRNGTKADTTVVLINGIMSDASLHHADMQILADTGLNVVGIHNSTKSMFRDVAQSLGQKLGLDLAMSTVVETTADVIYEAIGKQEPVHLIGHSQGALIASRALIDVKKRLMIEDGLSDKDATTRLADVTVETLGGAATRFPDGPAFIHHVNHLDFVPMLTGVGPLNLNPFANPGAGAVIHTHQEKGELHSLPKIKDGLLTFFARATDRLVHGPQDIYFNLRNADSKEAAVAGLDDTKS